MKTQIKYRHLITLENLDQASQAFSPEENQEMHDKLSSLMACSVLPDSVFRALAKEYARWGYLAAHCEKDKSPTLREVKETFKNIY